MKGFKRGLSLLLSVLVIMSLFAVVPVSADAAETSKKASGTDDSTIAELQKYIDFKLPNYRANRILDSSNPDCKLYNNFISNTETPSDILFKALSSDVGYMSGFASWKALTFNPSNIGDGMLDEVGYYEAIIISAIKQITEDDTFLDSMTYKYAKDTVSFNKSLTSFAKTYKGIEYSELVNSFKTSEVKRVMKEWADQELNNKWYNVSGDYLGLIKGTVDTAESVIDFIQKASTYIELMDTSQEIVSVVNALYNNYNGSDSALKTALYNVKQAISNSSGTMLSVDFAAVSTIGKSLFKEAVGALWKDVLSSNSFFAGVLIGQAVGKLITNGLFSTDKNLEQFYKMYCLCAFEDLMQFTTSSLKSNYQSYPTEENAKTFLATIDMLYHTFDLSCEYAKGFANIAFNSGLVNTVKNSVYQTDTYSNFINSVDSIQNSYALQYRSFSINWIEGLATDYPDIYSAITRVMDGYGELSSISAYMLLSSIEVGRETRVLYTLNPSKVRDVNVTFESSNPFVATVDNNGKVKGVSEGTAQIKVISAANSSIYGTTTITVEARSSETHSGGSSSSVIGEGSCGDNVKWSLYANGLLIIYGSGRMKDHYSLDYSNIPWYGRRKQIKKVIISNDVTSIGGFAFIGCTDLTNVSIPDSVTSIGWNAFRSCENLTSITISDSVTYIGTEAFRSCTSLTSINIGNSVTSIGLDAFKYCTSLTRVNINDIATLCKISFYSRLNHAYNLYLNNELITELTIPDSVTYISDEAFRSCTNLTSVTIPDSVTYIGDEAFYGCSNLTSVTIPASVTSIGRYAFAATPWYNNQPDGLVYAGKVAYKIKGEYPAEVTIKDGTLGIADSAFSSCENLTSIKIPNSVTSIGDSAFSSCKSLTSITIPNSVTSIGADAFYRCTSLTNITIPNSVTSIGADAFEATPWYNNRPDGLVYAGKVAYKMKGECPAEVIIKNGTLGIADSALSSCESLTSITIPNSVTSLGKYAFIYCTSLTSITIPDSVSYIGDEAFRSCTSLTSVTIPDSVSYIGDEAFRSCTSLTSVTIPDSVTSIGGSAFRSCTSLASVTIGNSVTSIGEYSFSDCISLTSITIPDSVTYIGDEAFKSCTSLTSVTIPDSVTSIGQRAFYGCNSIETAIIGNGVTSLYGFYFNSNLKLVSIGNSVTSIGDSAFRSCESLTNITIPNSVTSIGEYSFYGCKSLTNITVPDSVTSIGEYAFAYCTSLTSVTIPDSVTSIGEYSFYGCESLTSITIPDSVTSIGEKASGYYYDKGYQKVDGFTIYGYPSSAAEKYANDNGFEFISLDDASTVQSTEPASESIPTEPSSSEDAPTEPTSSESQPTEPTSSESQPTEPSLSERNPTNPSASESNLTEPSSSENNPTESTTDKPVEPATTEPTEPITDKPTEHVTTEPTEPTTDKPNESVTTEPIEPTTDKPAESVTTEPQPTVTDPTTPTVKPSVKKKDNTVKVTVKNKMVKAKKLKIKKQSFKSLTITKAQGKVTVTIVKSGTTKKIRKLVSINKKGTITIDKWKKAKKGTYKIKVKVTAKGNSNYKSKSVTKTVKIKVK